VLGPHPLFENGGKASINSALIDDYVGGKRRWQTTYLMDTCSWKRSCSCTSLNAAINQNVAADFRRALLRLNILSGNTCCQCHKAQWFVVGVCVSQAAATGFATCSTLNSRLSTLNYLPPKEKKTSPANCKYCSQYLGIALATASDRYLKPQTSCSFAEPDVMDN